MCCGTKRLVEIACPAGCVFLDAAQKHPASAVRRQQEQDISALMHAVGPLSEAQLQLFFLLQTLVVRHAPPGLPRLRDEDVAEAAGAVAATLETAARGLVYEHQAASVVADGLRRELQALLERVGRGGGSRFEREAAIVLRGIERGARHKAPGVPESPTAYLDLVSRVLQERPAGTATTPAGSGLIIP